MNQRLFLLALVSLGASLLSEVRGQSCGITRISVGPGGVDVPSNKGSPCMSPDGRFVAYFCYGDGITPNDTNGYADVFVHDRLLGTTELVSASAAGVLGNGDGYEPRISGDGRYVTFYSWANNLVPGDLNGHGDVFLRDRLTGQVSLISLGPGGAGGDSDSIPTGISTDGSRIVFWSYASNLSANDVNSDVDAFLYDVPTGQLRMISVTPGGVSGNAGSWGPEISGDGNWIAFISWASDLVPGDSGLWSDAYLYEIATGAIQRLSVAPGGVEGDGDTTWVTISADGRYVSFDSMAANLVPNDTNLDFDVFVHDRLAGSLALVSAAPGAASGETGGWDGRISADGRYLAFTTPRELEPGDTNDVLDIYVRDLVGGSFARVVRSQAGLQAGRDCTSPWLAQSARLVCFASDDPELTAGDSPWSGDIFVRDCPFPLPPVYTSSCIGTQSDCPCQNAGNGYGGCENWDSTGGAELAAHGRASLSADTLRLYAWRLPLDVPTLFLQAPLSLPRTPWGDGLLCLGGGTNRLGIRFAHSRTVEFGYGIVGDPSLAVLSQLGPAGGTRSYQLIYRTPDPAYCPPGTFNLSNAIEVLWVP